MCRARARRRPASPRSTSCRPTRIRSAPRRRQSRRSGGWPTRWSSIRTARRPDCARRSARRTGSTRPTSSARTARTRSSACWRRPISTPGDEGIFTEHGFAVYRIYIQAAGGVPVVARETDERADVDAILAAVTPRTRIVFLANPEQSDRHLSAVRGGAPAACRPAEATCFWCSTRPTPNMSGATTTKPASSWSSSSQNVVMTRTFSKVHRAGRHAHRLDLCAAAHRRCAEPHARAVQRQRRGDRGGRRGDRATARMSTQPSRTTSTGWPG